MFITGEMREFSPVRPEDDERLCKWCDNKIGDLGLSVHQSVCGNCYRLMKGANLPNALIFGTDNSST